MTNLRTLLLAVVGVSLLTGHANAQAPAAPAGPPKLQALIITGQHGHDWRATTPFLKQALEETGRFEVRVTEEFRGAGPETLVPILRSLRLHSLHQVGSLETLKRVVLEVERVVG